MWKPSSLSTPSRPAEPERAATPAPFAGESVSRPTIAPSSANFGDAATIGKSLVIKGEISGAESLVIEGKVEGTISLPGNRVTIGRNGVVAANIQAREIVLHGKVHGNLDASDRVEIRAEGSLVGDITAARISVEDGAFVKGGIDLRKPVKDAIAEARPNGQAALEPRTAERPPAAAATPAISFRA